MRMKFCLLFAKYAVKTVTTMNSAALLAQGVYMYYTVCAYLF